MITRDLKYNSDFKDDGFQNFLPLLQETVDLGMSVEQTLAVFYLITGTGNHEIWTSYHQYTSARFTDYHTTDTRLLYHGVNTVGEGFWGYDSCRGRQDWNILTDPPKIIRNSCDYNGETWNDYKEKLKMFSERNGYTNLWNIVEGDS